MENRINLGDRNTRQVGLNSVNQSAQIPEKPKINYLLICLVVLACFVVFGFGGYYLGKQSNFSPATEDQSRIIPSVSLSPTDTNNPSFNEPTIEPSTSPTTKPTTKEIVYKRAEGWSSYNSDLGFTFQYPSGYSSPKKNPVDPGQSKEKYCEFTSTRKLTGNQIVESLWVKVLPYTGGSRRQFLIDTLALSKSTLLTVEDVKLSGIQGLNMSFKPEYPTWSKQYAGIFIQSSTALIISNLQIVENSGEWNSVLESLQINQSLHTDISKCQNDW